MIKAVADNDAIITLWYEAFGDSREDILFFINNLKHGECIGYYNDSGLLSMLYLVDCSVNELNFKYIYAACTLKSARGCGYMGRLLEYALDEYDNVLLIPADEGLVKYYCNRGFTHKINIENILFNESKEIREYLFEGCELDFPFALSNTEV